MAHAWTDEELQMIAAARGGTLWKVKRLGKKQTPFLFVECSYGHTFSKPVNAILGGAVGVPFARSGNVISSKSRRSSISSRRNAFMRSRFSHMNILSGFT